MLASASPPVVILVHGTWAPHAAWTMPDSLLRRAIDEGLGEATVVERFQWSGRNSHSARVRGGRRLAAFLASVAERYPDSPIAMVAHSHGGNVCIEALRRAAAARARVQRLICMSTPFLVPRMTDTGRLGTNLFFLVPSSPLAAALAVWVLSAEPHWAVVFGAAVLLWLSAMILGILWLSLCNYLYPDPWFPPSDRLVILRMTGDEASAALGLASFVNWLAFQSWNFIRFLPGALLGRLYMLDAALQASHDLRARFLLGVPMKLLLDLAALFLCLPAFVVQVATIVFSWLAGAGHLAVASGYFSLTAEATPPGQYVVHHYRTADRVPFDDAPPPVYKGQLQTLRDAHERWIRGPLYLSPVLAHSAVYDHPDALARIVTTLKAAAFREGAT